MIGTVTLNAAIDKRYVVDELKEGTVNRVVECRYTAGGKGLNVSRVVRLLGEQVAATGFLGGYAGRYIDEKIQQQGIETDFVAIGGESRSCINLYDRLNGSQTELLEPGGTVSEREQEQLLERVEGMAARCEVVVLSGSLPQGVDSAFYGKLIRMIKKKGKKALLDTSGEALRMGIKAGPYLVKPNSSELSGLYGGQEGEGEKVRKLLNMGIEVAAVSLGSQGAAVAAGRQLYRIHVPQVQAVNTVGCGDAMMAGFAVGLSRGYEVEQLLRFAAAVSVANALQEGTGYIEPEDVRRLLPKIQIERRSRTE